MPAVAQPSRKSAAVSLTPRPQRRSIAMKITVPNGLAIKASAKSTKDQSTPESGSRKGNITRGNTSTEAMAKTKKSKNSELRPITTPTAMSVRLVCTPVSTGLPLPVS